MKKRTITNSHIINGIALGFSLFFLFAACIAAVYTGEWGHVFHNWYLIMISPCPLVTDYFAVGGLASALLNAGACGLACFLFMVFLKGESQANTLAGFFLVIAHCFYGLNFLNMWPCFLAPLIYLYRKRLNFNNNLHICMFATSFSPFISELLFRYTQRENFVFGQANLTHSGILLAVIFSVMIGYIIPAILPGAQAWHKGYNLYNGGLAFGFLGFFLYNLMYKTMGITPSEPIAYDNAIYTAFHHSYRLYANIFFLILFTICILAGYFLNGKTIRGLGSLLKNTGYSSNFANHYGMPVCLLNIGFHGFLILLYVNLAILFTEGAGFTGPTIGVVLAALTFTAMGQHPVNVWPILAGYQLLYFFAMLFCYANGRELTWSVSTQGYINGAAFATGLCPIVGRYGIRAGLIAGFMCASMCTATSALHGGFVLYNGGFTAGITAMLLLPFLEHYAPRARDEMKRQTIHIEDMIGLVENISPNTTNTWR
ncbi:DUF1576 domain-containing protein [Lachnospiraceae bacterium 62-35]